MDRRVARGKRRRQAVKIIKNHETKKTAKRKRQEEEDSSSADVPPANSNRGNKKNGGSKKSNKQNAKKRNKKTKPAFTLPKIDDAKNVPNPPGTKQSRKQANLSNEIASFADYVRLDKKELQSRESFINVVRNVVIKQYPQAQVAVFGSFATPAVCHFVSDVDITISNAIEVPERRKPYQTREQTLLLQEQEPSTKEKKQHLLKEKWLSALEEVENTKADSGTESDPIFVTSTSDDDTADPLKRDRLDSIDSVNLNISMSSDASSSPPKRDRYTANLVRRRIQDCLSSLRRRLHNLKSVQGIQFIANARVPILKIRTTFAMQADICIQEGQMTDTRLFASDCVATYGDRFSNVVLVLKMLLYQQGLDEPFSGGLGSFKLYALLSAYLSHQATNDEDIGQVLIGFLASFRKYSREIYLIDLEHSKNTEIDLTNVFRLHDIGDLFRKSRARLIKHQTLSTILSMSSIRSERSRLRGLSSANIMAVDVKKWGGEARATMLTMEASAVDRSLVAAR